MRKILLQIFSFSFIFMGIFALVRSLMVKNLTNESENSLMVYMYGLGHDMRTFSAIFLPFVGGKIKCRKRKIKCRIFATNYLSFNLKLKL
ncbi:hypothetical protein DIE35_03725 [Campylobacter coli]|nr:hypothetical protein [Campylobacter coli]